MYPLRTTPKPRDALDIAIRTEHIDGTLVGLTAYFQNRRALRSLVSAGACYAL